MAYLLYTKVDAIVLDYFDTHEHVLECLRKTASQTKNTFGDVTDTLFAKIPSDLAKIYLYSIDYNPRMDKDLFGLLRKQNSPNLILATMRIFARSQTDMEVLSRIYDLFFEMFAEKETASYDAWRVIEIGIAERHILYANDKIYDEESKVISTFERNTRYFVNNKKERVIPFAPPPAVSGYSFMRTILTTHFGMLIRRDLFSSSTLETYAKDKRIKKILNTRSNADTIKYLANLAAAAIGMYAKNPLQMYKDHLKKYETPNSKESIEAITVSYKDYNTHL